VNDTTRELGGALGVAVIGSVLSSLYDGRLASRVGEGLPQPALDAAKDSVGSALAVAGQVGGDSGSALAGAAREAFVHGMATASLVTAGIAALGVLVALRWLPARADSPVEAPVLDVATIDELGFDPEPATAA
jgi:hypothetical protein